MTPEKLAAVLDIPLARAEKWALPLSNSMAWFGIDALAHQAAFLANVAHETGMLTRTTENLNYSAKRLMEVWPGRFKTLESTKPYAGKPEALANFVYGGRLGNTQPGDGWKFRGRGLIQLTGRANYTEATEELGVDLLTDPDIVAAPSMAACTAGWFWSKRGISAKVDAKDYEGVCKAVNGGLNGLKERNALCRKAEGVLRAY